MLKTYATLDTPELGPMLLGSMGISRPASAHMVEALEVILRAVLVKTTIRHFLSIGVVGSSLLVSGNYGASFDCNRAKSPDERAICSSRQLSELDVEMSVRYEMLTGLVAMGARGMMQDEQQAWLNMRRKCRGNQVCLLSAYRHRLQMLKEDYARLASRGPF